MHTSEWTGFAYEEQHPKISGPLKSNVIMHHNGDYSGNIKFLLPNRIADASTMPHFYADESSAATVHIPFAAIKHLVLQYLRNKAISRLENVEDDELEDLIIGDI